MNSTQCKVTFYKHFNHHLTQFKIDDREITFKFINRLSIKKNKSDNSTWSVALVNLTNK